MVREDTNEGDVANIIIAIVLIDKSLLDINENQMEGNEGQMVREDTNQGDAAIPIILNHLPVRFRTTGASSLALRARRSLIC